MTIVRPVGALLLRMSQTPCVNKKTRTLLTKSLHDEAIEKECALTQEPKSTTTCKTNLFIQAAASIPYPACIADAFMRHLPELGGTIPPQISCGPSLYVSEPAHLLEIAAPHSDVAIQTQVRHPCWVELSWRQLAQFTGADSDPFSLNSRHKPSMYDFCALIRLCGANFLPLSTHRAVPAEIVKDAQ